MIPHELEARTLPVADVRDGKIVVFTGNTLRHDRFALRIQQRFGERVVAWYRITRPPKAPVPRALLLGVRYQPR